MTLASSYLRGRLKHLRDVYSPAWMTVDSSITYTYNAALQGGERSTMTLFYRKGELRSGWRTLPSVTVCALFVHAVRTVEAEKQINLRREA